MNKFVEAVKDLNNGTLTTNGMAAFKSTRDALVDLFYNIGSMRGKDVIPLFVKAYKEDREIALRIAQWARDIRGGAGERKIFRDILAWLDKNDPDAAVAVLQNTPEIGRWDDVLLDFSNDYVSGHAFRLVVDALNNKNGLVAKWLPRKGPKAVKIRSLLGWTPKRYRKTIVGLTNVVETQMCANEWDDINFSHVPSLASARYKKAFGRHSAKYAEYIQKLVKGDKSVKVNASAVYPYDVLKGVLSYRGYRVDQQTIDHVVAQWKALPNYLGDKKVLPVVDVSGSMASVRLAGGLTALEVACGLGLYCADKNVGPFADIMVTFSGTPELQHLTGNVVQKAQQMVTDNWMTNTDIEATMKLILETAVKNRVPQKDMPDTLLILSDMQFDEASTPRNRWAGYSRSGGNEYNPTHIQLTRDLYRKAGYKMPKIVYWNLAAVYGNNPVKFDEAGTAVVSGFSPAVLKSILSDSLDDFTPQSVMLKTVMVDRYALDLVD